MFWLNNPLNNPFCLKYIKATFFRKFADYRCHNLRFCILIKAICVFRKETAKKILEENVILIKTKSVEYWYNAEQRISHLVYNHNESIKNWHITEEISRLSKEKENISTILFVQLLKYGKIIIKRHSFNENNYECDYGMSSTFDYNNRNCFSMFQSYINFQPLNESKKSQVREHLTSTKRKTLMFILIFILTIYKKLYFYKIFI